MKMRWTTAVMVLPLLAALSGCGPDGPAQPLAPADGPALNALPDSSGASGGYYGSGHGDEPPPPAEEDTTAVRDW